MAAAKSRQAAALLERDAASTVCVFSALLAGLTDAFTTDIAPGVELELLSGTSGVLRPRLSLVRLLAGADVSVSSLLRLLDARGLPVVGTSSAPAPGGVHLALTSLTLPASLAEHCPGVDLSLPFSVEQPRKLAKTQRREALHAARRESLSIDEPTSAEFCQSSGLLPPSAVPQ